MRSDTKEGFLILDNPEIQSFAGSEKLLLASWCENTATREIADDLAVSGETYTCTHPEVFLGNDWQQCSGKSALWGL